MSSIVLGYPCAGDHSGTDGVRGIRYPRLSPAFEIKGPLYSSLSSSGLYLVPIPLKLVPGATREFTLVWQQVGR